MNKKQIEKIVAGIAVAGSIVGGTFMVSRDTQKAEIKEMRKNLVEKSEQQILTYGKATRMLMYLKSCGSI